MKKTLISTSLLLAFSSLAYGQQAEQLAPINVYSAYAAPVNQDQTASSVTVLTEKDFSARNATYVSDVLKTVPSVAIGASGGRGTLTNFYLRGADANHTAVIIDGVKMNPVQGYGFDFGGLSLSNVERIEVLRGEQSALWGSDAMGGVIYITTKSGLYKDKPFNLDFDLGTGSARTRDASATVSGYHNGFYYAVHGDSHRTRGISALSEHHFAYTAENGTPIKTGGAKEDDKFHRDNASLRLGYDKDDMGIEIFANRSSQTTRFDNSLATDQTSDDRTRTRETVAKLSGYIGSEQTLFKHKANLSHIKTDSETAGVYASSYEGKKLNGSYQLDINFDREGAIKQAFSLLAEYQKAKYQSNFYQDQKELTEKSLAGEYRLFSEDDHSLSVSGRYTDNNQYENAFTGRVSGAYRLSPNFRAHASLGSAIQNPTINEYYGYNGKFIGNPNLKPEKSRGGDLGLLIQSNDKNHSLDLTYFASNVENLISSKIVDFTTFASQAVNLDGKSKIKGFEVAYNGKFNEQLSAYANYTYTRAKDSKEMELVRRPKHLANLGVAYQITEKLGTSANISYVGKRIDSYFDDMTYQSSRVKLPSYTLFGLGANYQLNKNLNVYLNLNNLFDKKYENIIGYGQQGRNIYVGLKGSF